MNSEQVLSLARSVLQIAGTFLTTYGMLNATQWQTITGAVLMVVPVLWGIYTHTQTNAVAVVAKMDATEVTNEGRSIMLLKPELVSAARENATPPRV